MSVLFSICMGVFDPLDTLTVVPREVEEGKEKPAATKNWKLAVMRKETHGSERKILVKNRYPFRNYIKKQCRENTDM